ncbi:hypothetical protein [Stenotrophomonas sp. PD6]|uniref:hypothetical protein n=1 Tax=Stenotrophomonas sp. PD6 TaxID=3368612 RepID=UPI003BA251F6
MPNISNIASAAFKRLDLVQQGVKEALVDRGVVSGSIGYRLEQVKNDCSHAIRSNVPAELRVALEDVALLKCDIQQRQLKASGHKCGHRLAQLEDLKTQLQNVLQRHAAPPSAKAVAGATPPVASTPGGGRERADGVRARADEPAAARPPANVPPGVGRQDPEKGLLAGRAPAKIDKAALVSRPLPGISIREAERGGVELDFDALLRAAKARPSSAEERALIGSYEQTLKAWQVCSRGDREAARAQDNFIGDFVNAAYVAGHDDATVNRLKSESTECMRLVREHTQAEEALAVANIALKRAVDGLKAHWVNRGIRIRDQPEQPIVKPKVGPGDAQYRLAGAALVQNRLR